MQLASGVDTVRLRRALWMTLLAVTAYHAAGYVLLPGVSLPPDLLSHTGGPSRLSIMALGIVPWLSALLLFEFASLFWPSSRWCGSDGHANAFAWPVLASALALAVLQAYGVTTALRHMPQIVNDPSTSTDIGMIASMTAGTAFAMALAHLISGVGVGHGFWVLLAASFLPQLTQDAVLGFAAARQGAIGGASVAASLGMVGLIAAGTVGVLEVRKRSAFVSALPVVMPKLLGGVLAGWIMALPLVFSFAEQPVYFFRPGGIAQGVITTAIAFVLLWLYARREGSRKLFAPTAVLIAAAIAGDFAALNGFGLPALISYSTLMVVVAVLYSVLRSYYPALPVDDEIDLAQ